MEKIKTYVIHVRGNKDRERHIRNELNKFKIDTEFILDGNMEDITALYLEKYFKGELKKVSARTSCALKHFLAYERMVEKSIPLALVFEDDIELFPDFQNIFDQSVNEILNQKSGSYIISYESSTQDFISKSEEVTGKTLYHKSYGRCAGAYLLDLPAAKKILELAYKEKCDDNMDWFHNQLSDKGLVKIYWCHPPVAEQLSHNGKMQSLLDAKKEGAYYRLKYFFQKMYKKKILSRFR